MLTDGQIRWKAFGGCYDFYEHFSTFPECVGVHTIHQALCISPLHVAFPAMFPLRLSTLWSYMYPACTEVPFVIYLASEQDRVYFYHTDRADWIVDGVL
jgi:hypothetical protein